ncbi:MAG: hypothetical protein NTZ05_22035 [Chloroflexi bacterium]|nr:hypothetical protein [Chloroflexota bacterium]
MESTRFLTRWRSVAGPAPALASFGARAGGAVWRGVKELAGSQAFMLSVGGFSMMMSGMVLNSATTALMTSVQSVPTHSFAATDLNLGAPTFTAFSVAKAVPGDIYSQTIVISNGNGGANLSVPYYLSSFAASTSLLDSDTVNGLRMALFRCGTETAPATCATATTFESVTGVMNQGATLRVTTSSGVPSLAGMSVSGSNLIFTAGQGNIAAGGGATVVGVPVLTKNNPNTQGKCSVSNDGGCLLGGYSAVTVSNPATMVVSGAATISVPALTNVKGLGASSGDRTDNLLMYLFMPSDAATTMQSKSTTLTFAFTAVQPNGTLNPSR